MSRLLKIICKCCGIIFNICRCCYRGHVYCGLECRKAGYREIRKKAQKNYRNTKTGRKQHSEAENRRRHRKKGENPVLNSALKTCDCIKKIIRSMFENDKNTKEQTPKCSFCGITGKSVDKFPKRRYGKTNPVFNAPC